MHKVNLQKVKYKIKMWLLHFETKTEEMFSLTKQFFVLICFIFQKSTCTVMAAIFFGN